VQQKHLKKHLYFRLKNTIRKLWVTEEMLEMTDGRKKKF